MLYFAYCTLLDTAEMGKYCPNAAPAGVGRVTGYRVTFERHAPGSATGGCNLVAADGHEVYGLLYELSEEELAGLDAISGVGRGAYRRVELRVTTLDGSERPAVTYEIPNPGGPYSPDADYTRPILVGAEALELPPAYLAELRRVVSDALDDTARHILVSREGPLATITIDRPAARNAVSYAMLLRLEAELEDLAADLPRVIILRATAPGFCAGIDLKESREATSEFAGARSRTMHGVLRRLRSIPAPVIVAVDGVAAGLGAELVISGDLRLASPASRIGYPEPRVGVPSPAHYLVRLIGLARAQDMLLTARWVEAAEAERIGLVTRVVDGPDTAARELAEQLLRHAPLAMSLMKEYLWRSNEPDADAATELHVQGIIRSAGTRDRREALEAFREKREPRFTGE